MVYIHYLVLIMADWIPENRIDLLLNWDTESQTIGDSEGEGLALFTSLQLSYYEKFIREKQFL